MPWRAVRSFPGPFGHAGVVDAGDIRRLAAEAFGAAPFEPVSAGRWQARTEELIWAVDLDRSRSWSAWSVMVGIVVRERHAGLAVPRHNDGDVMVDYSALGDAVPPTAAGSRFDDHRSYFTMVFDHRHDLAGEDERTAAFAFMAGDLARLAQELPAVMDLRGGGCRAVRSRLRAPGPLSGGDSRIAATANSTSSASDSTSAASWTRITMPTVAGNESMSARHASNAGPFSPK